MMGCAIFISLADLSKHNDTVTVHGESIERVRAFIAVLISIACPFTFCGPALSVRLFKNHLNFPVLHQKMLSQALQNTGMIIALFFIDTSFMSSDSSWRAALSSVFTSIG